MSLPIYPVLTTLLAISPTVAAQDLNTLPTNLPVPEQVIVPCTNTPVTLQPLADFRVKALGKHPEPINVIQFSQRASHQSKAAVQASKAGIKNAGVASVQRRLSADRLPQIVSQNISEAQSSSVEPEDELFERIFGRSQHTGAQQINVPFFIDDQLQGQLLVLTATTSASTVRLQAAALLEKLRDVVRPDIFQGLTASVDGVGNLSLNALQQSGLVATFDERRLEVRVQIPPTLRQTRVNTVGNVTTAAVNAIHPSRVSGYLNVQGAAGVIWSGKTESEERQSLNLNIDGVLNVDGWVLEGSADLSAGSPWTRGDFRLVRDDPGQAVRYTLGEQILPGQGYQSSLPMLGFSAVRNFSLQPYAITRPISRFEFFLERPSTVDIFISDRFTQTLRLPAGPQDIRNLPLNAGINEVQLVVTDDLGRVQRLNFSGAVAADLLAPGIQQFAYGIGVPVSNTNGNPSYNWNQPTLSLANRWGLSETLTLGGYLQANPDRQVAGVEGAWATSLGNFSWDVAVSHDQELGFDSAAQLVYEVLRLGDNNPTQRSLRLALEYRGENFRPLNNLTPQTSYRLDVSATYAQQIFNHINATLNGRYQVGRDETGDAYSLGLGLSRAFDHGISVSVNLNHQHTREGTDEQQAFISLFWLFPQQRQSLVTTANIGRAGASTQTTWNFESARTVDRLSGSVSLNTNPDLNRLTGKLDYTGYRANLGFSQELQISSNDQMLIGNSSQLTFGTALVFADGHVGWSRPVNNSFALVVRQGNLRRQVVEVNPNGGGYVARADALGPAVIPDLQPYYLSPVQIAVTNIPIGYDIGAQRYQLLPTYRSGTVVYVGTDATVFLRGTVLDNNGGPIALQTGEVVSLSDPTWKPMTVFTNRAGRFALSGFKPGQFELRFDDQRVIPFEIPAGQEGIYDVGTLRVQG